MAWRFGGARRRGFTLVETALAMLIGGVALLTCVGLFAALQRAERNSGERSRHATELATTQQVVRRSLMGMVMLPDGQLPEELRAQLREEDGLVDDDAVEPDEPDEDEGPDPDDQDLSEEEASEMGFGEVLPRPRLLLELDLAGSIQFMVEASRDPDAGLVADPARGAWPLSDPTAWPGELEGLGLPQRLEVVVAKRPAPDALRVAGAGWARAEAQRAQEVLYEDLGLPRAPQEGGVRGVFELRPDGARERVQAGFGLAGPAFTEGFGVPAAAKEAAEGWTLWWRPVLEREYVVSQLGQPFDPAEHPETLAEAVPLIRGLSFCRWRVFDQLQPRSSFSAIRARDVPGYVELEMQTTSGAYANWMFELGWTVAQEAIAAEPTPEEGSEESGEGEGGGTDLDGTLRDLQGGEL